MEHQMDSVGGEDRPDVWRAGVSRRAFLGRSLAWGAAGSGAMALSGCGGADAGEIDSGLFRHGVASGDPLVDRVIIWTHVTSSTAVDLQWEFALDPVFAKIERSGQVSTSLERDNTAKMDVTGLKSGQTYYYRFRAGAETSDTGRTRTLPQGDVSQIRLAVFSCANYQAGYFHAYGDVARRDDIDCAVQLGDYVYETGASGDESLLAIVLKRDSDPEGEVSTLQGYRSRHAQYRNDASLRALHASVAMIAVWDDHDIVNGTWRDGAGDADPIAQGFVARRAAAVQAWREWLPIRETAAGDPLKIYRSFDFGNLLSLHMLDTRVIGRDQPLTTAQYLAGAGDGPARQLLGAEQSAWLQAKVQASGATWQVLGQQVLMAPMHLPLSIVGDFTQDKFAEYFDAQDTAPAQRSDYQNGLMSQPLVPYNLDAWDGYPAARASVLGMARALGKNLVVLAGDTHNAWASDLLDASGNNVGVEFAGASVSSPGFEASALRIDSSYLASAMVRAIPQLRYAQTNRRGYMLVSFTPAETRADWKFISSTLHNSYSIDAQYSLRTLPGLGQRRLLQSI